jgi:PAS domain S-box-containing protein
MVDRPDLLILDEIDEGYYEVDLAGRFTFVNQSFGRLVRLSPSELIGLDNRAYMSEDSAREIFRIFQSVYLSGELQRVKELEVARRDGSRIWVEFTVALRRDAQGAPLGFRGIIHDLTARKKTERALEEANTRLRGLIQAIPDIVYFKDTALRNLVSNQAFEKAFGLSEGSIAGKTDDEILPPGLAAAYRHSDELVLTSGKPYRFEETMSGRDGREVVFETIKSAYRDGAGEISGLVGVSRDITDRKRTEAALQESEERFRTLYENSTVGLYRTTPDGRILLANPTMLRILGFDTIEELSKRNLETDGFEPNYARSVFKERIAADGLIRGLESAWRRKDGMTAYVRESARAIKDESGTVKFYEGTVEDITDRKRAELEVLVSEERYRRLFENSLEGIFQSTPEGRFIAANPALVRMFGYDSTKEFLEVRSPDLYANPYDREEIIQVIETLGEIRHREVLYRRRNGMTFHALLNATVVRDAAGRPSHYEGNLTDISDLTRSKTALQAALQEKEILLKEIHHRVKNNMQVISSLLNLQVRYLKDPEAIGVFRDSQQRIRAMALIHEKLYQSENLARVDFGNYIRHLTASLVGSQVKQPGQVEVRTEIENIEFDLKTSIPLGLIINELVSNALKHAFPDDRTGEIVIGLRRTAEGFLLTVRDTGVGTPGEIDIHHAKSMGFQLVSLLARQLDGRFELGPAPGTEFRVYFQDQPQKSRGGPDH